MNVDLSNQVVVVTGSSRGIGRELVIAYAKQNAKVVINYLSSEVEALELHKEINLYNQNCILVKADVTKKEDVEHLFAQTLATFGKVDVLVNNAGICDDCPIETMLQDQWNKVMEVNLTGTFLCSQMFTKAMIAQRCGKIVNIASLKGQIGSSGQANYTASKAGIIGLSKTLARELGKYNVQVNVVCPGYIETDLNRNNVIKKERAVQESVLNYQYALDDLINFVIFLSSDKVKGITGQVFNVDSRI